MLKPSAVLLLFLLFPAMRILAKFKLVRQSFEAFLQNALQSMVHFPPMDFVYQWMGWLTS
jgi:hypothetical protein